LAPYLPENLLPEALATAREIGNEYQRARALTGLAPHLPEILLEALATAREIRDEYQRARALTGLAPYLPENLLPEALATAREIGNESSRAEALKALTAQLTFANVDLSFWQDVLQALGSLTRPHFLETIPHLAPLMLHFGGLVALREVLQGIRDVSRWWK
ncbi:MAG: apoptotic protease-activating factor, partial [Microcystis panniformis Mp_GB_SS_20050300_S99D]